MLYYNDRVNSTTNFEAITLGIGSKKEWLDSMEEARLNAAPIKTCHLISGYR